MKYTLEVIAFNIESCLIAESAGAHRIELCDNPGEGGTTPSFGFIKEARKNTSIQLYPIIRPRGGDFHYSNDEFEIMKSDVQVCKTLGCDGVVIGLLNNNGTVDKERVKELVAIAYPMGVTFHRAFDRTIDAFQALEDIIDSGCERILTSGLRPNALEGADTIALLIEKANNRIDIMPGSGIRSNNIIEVLQKTTATSFHSSARILKNSSMKNINTEMKEEMKSILLDETEIKKIITALSTY